MSIIRCEANDMSVLDIVTCNGKALVAHMLTVLAFLAVLGVGCIIWYVILEWKEKHRERRRLKERAL